MSVFEEKEAIPSEITVIFRIYHVEIMKIVEDNGKISLDMSSVAEKSFIDRHL
ncbi:MAG: hypothetical protein ACRCUY_03775 [Thermoguttaceae bacterium]